MDTAIELKFADGTYRFCLPLPQIFELERKTGTQMPDGSRRSKSIFQIYDEMGEALGQSGDGDVVFIGGGKSCAIDIIETIRCGLIGGGEGMVNGEVVPVSPLTASQIVKDYCYPSRPLSECLGVAWSILHAAIIGVELKKKVEPEPIPSKPKRSRSTKA